MNLKQVPLILAFLFTTFSLFAQFKLEKTDEFFINSLNSIEIVDFNSSLNRYIGYEFNEAGFIVVLLDNKGEIIKKINLEGQGPGQFSSAMNFLGFSDDGDVWVITPNQLLVYDHDLTFKKSKKFALNNAFFTTFLTESPVFYYKKNSESILAFATYPSRTSKFMRKKSLDDEYLLEFFELNTGNSHYLAPVIERPIYKKLDVSVFILYRPIFVQNKSRNEVIVTATLDDEISIIDLHTNNTVSKIKINHGDFESFKKLPISIKTLPIYANNSLASKNNKLLYLDGGLIILDYIRAMSQEAFERKKEENKFYKHYGDPDYHRLIIFDQNKQLSGDIEIPYGEVKIATPDNSILIKLLNPGYYGSNRAR